MQKSAPRFFVRARNGCGGNALYWSAERGFLWRFCVCGGVGHFKGMDGCSVFGAEAAPKKSALRFLCGVGCDRRDGSVLRRNAVFVTVSLVCGGSWTFRGHVRMQYCLVRLLRRKKSALRFCLGAQWVWRELFAQECRARVFVPVSPMRRKIGVSSKIHRIRIRQCEARRL